MCHSKHQGTPGGRPASAVPSRAILQTLGWSQAFEAPGPFPPGEGLEPARVLAACRGHLLVLGASGEWNAVPSGLFRKRLSEEGRQLCAGDWLLIRPLEDRALAQELLPRRTLLARQCAGASGRAQPLAANVDLVLIAMGLDRDFNPARLERLLALAWASGARPVVLLTKADLVEDAAPFVHRLGATAPGVPILPLSAQTPGGLESLRSLLAQGGTAVLVGSSGVGKSTLVNALLGRQARATQAVRSSDGRGRHTTSLRELFPLESGGCLIDTPGLREVGLLGEPAGLSGTFTEVEEVARACRFRDCRHGAEPGCAVQAAMAEGRLEPERYEAFLRLRREVDYAAARADERLWRARERKWKDITKRARQLGGR